MMNSIKTIKLWYQELPGLNKKGEKSTLPKPFIDIQVNYKHQRMIGLKALVDSGSDYNLFPGIICEALGIKIKKGKPVPIYGIGRREPLTAYRHFGIKIFLEGISFETFADFSLEHEVPILGQNGFFDKFKKITFDREAEEMTFIPK